MQCWGWKFRVRVLPILLLGLAGWWWWRQPARLQAIRRVEITNDVQISHGGFYTQGVMYGWDGQVRWRPPHMPFPGSDCINPGIEGMVPPYAFCRIRQVIRDPVQLSPNGDYLVRVVGLKKRYRIQTFRQGKLLGEVLIPPGNKRFLRDCPATNALVVVHNDGTVWLQTDIINPHTLYVLHGQRILAARPLTSDDRLSPDARYLLQYDNRRGGKYIAVSLRHGQIALQPRFTVPFRPGVNVQLMTEGVLIIADGRLYRATGYAGTIPLETRALPWRVFSTWSAYAQDRQLQVRCPGTGARWQCRTFGECYPGAVTPDGRYAAVLIRQQAPAALTQIARWIGRYSPAMGRRFQPRDRLTYALYERPGRLRARYAPKPDTAFYGNVYPAPDGKGLLVEERTIGKDQPEFVLCRD